MRLRCVDLSVVEYSVELTLLVPPISQVTEMGTIPNMGDMSRYLNVLQRVKSTKTLDILALGGSITAGGYFLEFARSMEVKEGYKVNTHNHGHGATEIQCKQASKPNDCSVIAFYLYCVSLRLILAQQIPYSALTWNATLQILFSSTFQ